MGRQFEISRSVNEYHRLKLRSPVRDWYSVPAGTCQIQTGLSIPDSTEKRSFAPRRWGKIVEEVSFSVVLSLNSTMFGATVGHCPYWIH